MRELKFRAWDNLDKKFLWPWPEGFHLLGEVTCFDLISQQLSKSDRKTTLDRINDVEITQYTGLKDKNGKEIYEGDILKWMGDSTGIEYIKPVIFYQGAFCLEIPEINNFVLIGREMNKFEIIGNIYENFDILKNKE